jgi:hypothetical protein
MPKYIVFVFSWETPSAADADARSKMTVLTADAAGKKIVIEQTTVLKDSTELAEFVRQHKLAKSHPLRFLSAVPWKSVRCFNERKHSLPYRIHLKFPFW